MARPSSSQPTEVELQILRILWKSGPSIVRDIHARLKEDKETNYSTTVKMLAVMMGKQLVARDEDVRPHVYRAAVTQQKVRKHMLGNLMEKLYDGSAKTLVLHALSSSKASPEDMKEIRLLLEKIEEDES